MNREDIARIIDPGAWALADEVLKHTAAGSAGVAKYIAPSLAKADQIIALSGGLPKLPPTTVASLRNSNHGIFLD